MVEVKFDLKPVGVIHSPYKTRSESPNQGCLSDKVCEIEVFKEFEVGLKDVEGFSHLIILYLFHKSEGFSLLQVTPWEDKPHGVFAIRSPNRPNPIGHCVVELVERRDNVLRVRGLDAIDGTPLLDIKPYFPDIDQPKNVKTGWFGKSKFQKT
jgi:tRNA-Thr(GGU) m(6)t(6)A37 methyltransferase TsaA